MIDAHIHIVPPGLPGVGSLSPVLDLPLAARVAALRQSLQSAGVDQALAMGCWNAPPDDPLGVSDTLAMARDLQGLFVVGVADPARTDAEHLRKVDAALAAGRVRALKGYLGYLPFGPDHPGYIPYYELAARRGLPFIFHTGDTYSPRARLRFAQPLGVDDVAVDHPDVRFVLAHCGHPWLLEAAEVVYKNVNVWADLSGLAVGAESAFLSDQRRELLQDTIASLQKAFRYAERPNRFLYGSDWPLAPMTCYRDLIRSAIPEVHHALVFDENARALFRL